MKLSNCSTDFPDKDGFYLGVNSKGAVGLLIFQEGKWYSVSTYKETVRTFWFNKYETAKAGEFFTNEIDAINFSWINNVILIKTGD